MQLSWIRYPLAMEYDPRYQEAGIAVGLDAGLLAHRLWTRLGAHHPDGVLPIARPARVAALLGTTTPGPEVVAALIAAEVCDEAGAVRDWQQAQQVVIDRRARNKASEAARRVERGAHVAPTWTPRGAHVDTEAPRVDDTWKASDGRTNGRTDEEPMFVGSSPAGPAPTPPLALVAAPLEAPSDDEPRLVVASGPLSDDRTSDEPTPQATPSDAPASKRGPRRSPEVEATVDRVLATWRDLHATTRAAIDGPPGAKRRQRVHARLSEGCSEADLVAALRGAQRDDWLMGRDPKARAGGWRGVETLLRDRAQVERLAALDAAPPALARRVDRWGRHDPAAGTRATDLHLMDYGTPEEIERENEREIARMDAGR